MWERDKRVSNDSILGLPAASKCFQENDTNQLCVRHDLV